jgi:hypothetical protein
MMLVTPTAEPEPSSKEITLSRPRLAVGLSVGMAIVSLAGLLAEILKSSLDLKGDRGLVPIFSMSYEQNVPTWYSSLLLFTTGALLFVIGADAKKSRDRFATHWYALGAGFFYISMDEVVSIHEYAGWLRLGGVLYFSWVIPAALIVALVGLSYLRFLKHLEPKTRLRFLIAGAIYVGGAVGMELPLGYWTERAGTNNLVYGVIDWVEESMEILGVTLFLLALFDHLRARDVRLRFHFKNQESNQESR